MVAKELEQRVEQEFWVSPEKTSPSMLLINTRMFLYEMGQTLGHEVTIKDVPDEVWLDYATRYDSIWFMGMYTPSPKGVELAKTHLDEYKKYALSDVTLNDVIGSPFAIYDYSPDRSVASSWEEWDAVKEKLNGFGIKVWGDFVPNHLGIDHPWTKTHPEFFIKVDKATYDANPNDYFAVETESQGTVYYAKGRDPYFPSWEDTVQLDYTNPATHQAMQEILLGLVDHFDGVRCDMAMLINANKYWETWGWYLKRKNIYSMADFWFNAVYLAKQKAQEVYGRDFGFLAETYDDYSNELLGQYGFDYEYQKHFYDDLKRVAWENPEIHPGNITEMLRHFLRTDGYRRQKWAMFVENHDEERAVHEFGDLPSLAAATVAAFVPNSLFLVNEDQEKGFAVRPRVQLRRHQQEQGNPEMIAYYQRLHEFRNSPAFQYGKRCVPSLVTAGKDDISFANIIPQQGTIGNETMVVVTNFSRYESSGYLAVPKNAVNVEVYDLALGAMLPQEKIARVNDHGRFFIKLPAWRSQVIHWIIPEEQNAAEALL